MASPFDQDHWERRWANTLREHADKVAGRAPNRHLTADVVDLAPGRALDAGCGHGVESLWLAAHGWQVTAVDFSEAALAYGRATAEAAGLAEQITWFAADLTTWAPPADHYDLVVCLHVHVPGEVADMVRRMASAVAPGGTLFLVGQSPFDPVTGQPTAASNQVQVSVEAALAALDDTWEVVIAAERTRSSGGGVDAVIRARRSQL